MYQNLKTLGLRACALVFKMIYCVCIIHIFDLSLCMYWAYRLSTLFPQSVTPGGGNTLRERLRSHKVFTKYMYQCFFFILIIIKSP